MNVEVTATVIPEERVVVTCRHCGSADIRYTHRVMIQHTVKTWNRAPNGTVAPADWSYHRTVEDSEESVEFPYDCNGCFRVEMDEDDLLFDGKPFNPP